MIKIVELNEDIKSQLMQMTIDEFARNIKDYLKEKNLGLIKKIASTVSRESFLQMYKLTCDIQNNQGGMKHEDPNIKGKRTPGGVLFYLFKKEFGSS